MTRRTSSPDSQRYMTQAAESAAVTRCELAMIRAAEAFQRWAFFLHRSVSGTALSANDIYLLHSIRMRGGAQNLSELLLFLNRSDVSTIQYSLRKIEQHGLIERVVGNSKREAGYRLTESGMAATDAYARVREEILIALTAEVSGFESALQTAAAALERLTGLYDQSTQTVLNRKILSR
jgi:predicted MarR family transcription regulator